MRLTACPSRRSTACARRYPHRGWGPGERAQPGPQIPVWVGLGRSVYGSLLTDWLKAPDLKPILGANYPKMGLVGA